ncbi:hypothetical protein AVEN_39916-1 [Araneus ventricosus]|uniref:Uncharacterized protein n=1 Tax=Araneus ventricosus TaxID=182803 RepID=A0A4Y2V405_ARAVE|nr:hypothetical protein AVEN_208840-1 [Araneus ventricosus]GBO19232.1 hypothetical protein AVEN_39916-1 [Araneus ventricosus]
MRKIWFFQKYACSFECLALSLEYANFKGNCYLLNWDGKFFGIIGMRGIKKLSPLAIPVITVAGTTFSPRKRLRNIADNADRKAHNLYLNHTQATPNAEYVDYEDEETDCSSDISEVILNLNTYKPSTSNRLIPLTDPKYKQLTSFVAESSQVRLGLPSTAVAGDRFGISDLKVFFTMSVS